VSKGASRYDQMQIVSLRGLFLAATFAVAAQPRAEAQNRLKPIVVQNYGIAIARPKGWYVFGGGELPAFYNFPAENMLPQGELPPRGAAIRMLVDRDPDGDLSKWAEKAVIARRGVNAKKKSLSSAELLVSFDKPPLGDPGDSLCISILVRRVRGTVFAAELTYIKGDSHANQHLAVLRELMKSLRPL